MGKSRDEAVSIMKSFLVGGLKLKDDDSGAVIARVQAIVNEGCAQKGIRDAVRKYETDGDLDAFLTSLCPLHSRIFYEGYGEYWLSHCRPVTEHDDEVEFTYYNDLIDMYWAADWHEWKKKGEWSVTVMLPPTKGLLVAAYKEEMRLMHKCKREAKT